MSGQCSADRVAPELLRPKSPQKVMASRPTLGGNWVQLLATWRSAITAPRQDVNDPLRRALGRLVARATGVVHVLAW